MQHERPSEELNRRNNAFDNRLRPSDFDGFVGQQKIRDRLLLAVEAAKARGESLDHVLFSGPPGLGKTTLSYILGEAMNVNVKTTSGPVITKPGDLAGLLTSLDALRSAWLPILLSILVVTPIVFFCSGKTTDVFISRKEEKRNTKFSILSPCRQKRCGASAFPLRFFFCRFALQSYC